MSKFDTLYRSYEANIRIGSDVVSEALQPPGQPQQTAAPAPQEGPQSVQPQTPAPQEVKEPTADVTSEGKKFLVELALKALAVDPDNITATEKEIFNTEITTENADQILSRIQGIVDLYG
jgi:hypothetical protein